MEGKVFLGVGDVFGTRGEGSTVIGMSGMLTSGRALGLGAGVSVAAGKGGSCATSNEAQQQTLMMMSRFIRSSLHVGTSRPNRNSE